MDTKQAFNLIDQVCSRFQGTRQDHQALLEALQLLNAQLFPSDTTAEPVADQIEPTPDLQS